MPNSPRHYRSNRGRMGGNMMPLPHAVHTMNYMTHPQPAKEFMSLPRQVLFSTLSCSINDVNIGKYIHLLHGLLCDLCLHIKHFHQICPQCVCVCVFCDGGYEYGSFIHDFVTVSHICFLFISFSLDNLIRWSFCSDSIIRSTSQMMLWPTACPSIKVTRFQQ